MDSNAAAVVDNAAWHILTYACWLVGFLCCCPNAYYLRFFLSSLIATTQSVAQLVLFHLFHSLACWHAVFVCWLFASYSHTICVCVVYTHKVMVRRPANAFASAINYHRILLWLSLIYAGYEHTALAIPPMTATNQKKKNKKQKTHQTESRFFCFAMIGFWVNRTGVRSGAPIHTPSQRLRCMTVPNEQFCS